MAYFSYDQRVRGGGQGSMDLIKSSTGAASFSSLHFHSFPTASCRHVLLSCISFEHLQLTIVQITWLLFGLSAFQPVTLGNNDPCTDMGQAPAISVRPNQHHAHPPSGLNMMCVYSTNFDEIPYCCPWNPKSFEVQRPPSQGWGIVPTICQVADAGQNSVFNANGTVLLGDSWLKSNGSVV